MVDQEHISSYSLNKITKTFPGVLAVDRVDLTVRQGEIHGIIGKNGAGKSVLMSLIAGIQRSTSGEIYIKHTQVDTQSYNPAKAHELGVVLIPQEPVFAPFMSVVDNIFIGIPVINRLGLLNHRTMEKKVEEISDRLQIQLHPHEKMGNLKLEDQQLLAFGKAMFINNARVMLLDEITASLPRERKILLLRSLRQAVKEKPKISFTLITHHINEVIEFCDRVTVMRDGQAITTLNVSETNNQELANLIVGDAQDYKGPVHHKTSASEIKRDRPVSSDNTPLLSLKSVSYKKKYSNVSFDLVQGQVIGLAGLDGSGKHELLETLTGLVIHDNGEIYLQGRRTQIKSPVEALKNGIAYLPKKREEQAIIHNRSVEENILISIYQKLSNYFGVIDKRRAKDTAINGIKMLNVKTPGLDTIIDYLSGGNRQKVVLNRLDNTQPKVFVLNEPTRGVDLATKPEILRAIRDRFTQHGGVIFTSESEDELIEASDIIYVFFKGEIRKTFCRTDPDFLVSEVYKASQGVGL